MSEDQKTTIRCVPMSPELEAALRDCLARASGPAVDRRISWAAGQSGHSRDMVAAALRRMDEEPAT